MWNPRTGLSGSVSSGSSSVISRSGRYVPGRPSSAATSPRLLRRNRSDSPTPIFAEIRASFVTGATPGIPTSTGMLISRRCRPRAQARMDAVSKQTWLAM